MKTSKYKGGSKIVSFRLPLTSLSLATKEINELLKKYEHIKSNKDKTAGVPALKQSKTTLATKALNNIVYPCGCSYDSGLFRRVAGCRIDRGMHR